MTAYANLSGTSPVEAYEVVEDHRGEAAILVRFRATRKRTARVYHYEGGVVNTLIELALIGQGLATFIARERPAYARRY